MSEDGLGTLSKTFRVLVNEISRNPNCSPFLFPVSSRDFPDFYKMVSDPVAISTIKERLTLRFYKSREELLLDVQRIVENCRAFCGAKHPVVVQMAEETLKLFENGISEISEEIALLEYAISRGIAGPVPSWEGFTEDTCFVCDQGGELLICDYEGCSKVYHSACTHAFRQPTGPDSIWFCPRHFCKVCKSFETGRRLHKCSLCPTSLCPSHITAPCCPSSSLLPITCEGDSRTMLCSNCLANLPQDPISSSPQQILNSAPAGGGGARALPRAMFHELRGRCYDALRRKRLGVAVPQFNGSSLSEEADEFDHVQVKMEDQGDDAIMSDCEPPVTKQQRGKMSVGPTARGGARMKSEDSTSSSEDESLAIRKKQLSKGPPESTATKQQPQRPNPAAAAATTSTAFSTEKDEEAEEESEDGSESGGELDGRPMDKEHDSDLPPSLPVGNFPMDRLRSPGTILSTREATYRVLRELKIALTSKDIVLIGTSMNFIRPSGNTPDRTVAAMIYTNMRAGSASQYVKIGPGHFGLRELCPYRHNISVANVDDGKVDLVLFTQEERKKLIEEHLPKDGRGFSFSLPQPRKPKRKSKTEEAVDGGDKCAPLASECEPTSVLKTRAFRPIGPDQELWAPNPRGVFSQKRMPCFDPNAILAGSGSDGVTANGGVGNGGGGPSARQKPRKIRRVRSGPGSFAKMDNSSESSSSSDDATFDENNQQSAIPKNRKRAGGKSARGGVPSRPLPSDALPPAIIRKPRPPPPKRPTNLSESERFCAVCAKVAPKGDLAPHPQIACMEMEIYICEECLLEMSRKRDEAEMHGYLVLEGEGNEEICSICGGGTPDDPLEVVCCDQCERSYCIGCADRMFGEDEILRVRQSDVWWCPVCRRTISFDLDDDPTSMYQQQHQEEPLPMAASDSLLRGPSPFAPRGTSRGPFQHPGFDLDSRFSLDSKDHTQPHSHRLPNKHHQHHHHNDFSEDDIPPSEYMGVGLLDSPTPKQSRSSNFDSESYSFSHSPLPPSLPTDGGLAMMFGEQDVSGSPQQQMESSLVSDYRVYIESIFFNDPASLSEHESQCFLCKSSGPTIWCDYGGCRKAYHPQCLNMRSKPPGFWHCPYHFCCACNPSMKGRISSSTTQPGSSLAASCWTCPQSYCDVHMPGVGTYGQLQENIICPQCLPFFREIETSGAE